MAHKRRHAVARGGGGVCGRRGGLAVRCGPQRPDRGTRVRGARPALKQGRGDTDGRARHSNGRQRFEYNSNSIEFKLLQNLPNFDQSKNNIS
jgi:hypothetical protein